MDCKFITNGIQIRYDGVIRPCCVFKADTAYDQASHINVITNINTWQDSIKHINTSLNNNVWPNECRVCESIERQGRSDSMRLNAESSYGHYDAQDITLEIRPGNVCNFACQTCWPQASTRVAKYYKDAGIDFVPATNISGWDLSALQSVSSRIRDIIILGGEPFYDKNCLGFLKWIDDQQIAANLLMFTNGSVLDKTFLENYPGKITLVFSIDAYGKPAEYIREGTVWDTVYENYMYARSLTNVEVRVNITTSPYNYQYLPELLNWLAADWPDLVTFGIASAAAGAYTSFMDESVFPEESRETIANGLESTIATLAAANIEEGQKHNAINALASVVQNLRNFEFNSENYQKFLDFIAKMDALKGIKIEDFCPEVAKSLNLLEK